MYNFQVDATLFSVLAQIVYAPYDLPQKKLIMDELTNLKEYCDRMRGVSLFFILRWLGFYFVDKLFVHMALCSLNVSLKRSESDAGSECAQFDGKIGCHITIAVMPTSE